MSAFVNEMEGRENLVKNIKYVMFRLDIKTQQEFADKMEIAPATLVKILNKKQTPTLYPFFSNITKLSGYSVEDLLNTDLAKAEKEELDDGENDLDENQKNKLCGLYILHYFDTSAFKGRENKNAGEALVFGLLLIYKDKGKYCCLALFGLKREEMLERFKSWGGGATQNISMLTVAAKMKEYRSVHVYEGIVDISNGHIYLNLNYGNRDRVYVILHRPDGTAKHYIGGLGAMLSVSKGRYSSPCLQILGVSRYNLDVSGEEISRRLQLGYPSIKPGDKCEPLIRLIQQMYQPQQEITGLVDRGHFEMDLTDVHKEYIIRGEITKIITDIIENNMFRTTKISYIDDDEWYHFVKKFDPRKR